MKKMMVMRVLLLAVATAAAAATHGGGTRATALLSQGCSKARYPSVCVSTLSEFTGAATGVVGEMDLVHASLNVTLHRVGKALDVASTAANLHMDTRVRAAYEDCMELLEDMEYHLSRSLEVVSPSSTARASDEDVLTWLSAAVTSQDTCMESLDEVPGGEMKNDMVGNVKELGELISNCLAVFANVGRNKEFDGIPIENRRRRLMGLPSWVGRKDRRLLQMPASSLKPDFIVSKDGNGTHDTIAAAVKAAPKNSTRRIIVYIRAGRYDENIKVGRKKMNMMFVGDSKANTIIAGGRSVFDNFTTFHTATFAATGAGFIARDITFENWAGPARHQAVALRVGADHAVVYRCNVIGYQDSLYVHSLRQFFRECDIYGTVDFIFGNAAVVFQNCSIYARKPMHNQKNTITAQNRKDPNQNTGISIHACLILAHYDLRPVSSSFPTYLGRPWKPYARTVYMMSYMSDHIHPRGWLPWKDADDLDTLFYAEYMNRGPGASVASRVTWPGYRVLNTTEASRFTVGNFITGSSWLPSTGIAFLAGLSI